MAEIVQVVAALIWDRDRFLACQRPAHKARGLLWEFVGGKVEPGESRQTALLRECREELNIEINVRNIYCEVDHIYPDITIHLTLFNAEISSGVPELLEHNDLRWILPAEIPHYAFCPADTEILRKIQDDFLKLNVLRNALFSSADPKYKLFHCSLMPTVPQDRVLGVRMPVLRRIVKSLLGNADWFLSCMPLQYYEEQSIYGILISQCTDFDKCVYLLNQFLPYVDNWATCDLIVPAAFRNNPEQACMQALSWLKDCHPYTVRFGIGVLMRFGLDSAKKKEYTDLICAVNSDEYYVKMMVAWYFSTAFSRNFPLFVSYLEQNQLTKWVHNKAIQKGIESDRLTADQKDYLRKLRR